MSYMLGHIKDAGQLYKAVFSEEDRVVVMRFGHDWDPLCKKMDEVLSSIAEKVKNVAVIYSVDIIKVPDFKKMHNLCDPCTVMFIFHNSPIVIDFGPDYDFITKITWPLEDKQIIDIIEAVYSGTRKGPGFRIIPNSSLFY